MTVPPPPLSGLHLCVVRDSHELGQKNFPPLAGPDRPPLPARWLGSGDGVFFSVGFFSAMLAIMVDINAKLDLVGGEVCSTQPLTWWWRGSRQFGRRVPLMMGFWKITKVVVGV